VETFIVVNFIRGSKTHEQRNAQSIKEKHVFSHMRVIGKRSRIQIRCLQVSVDMRAKRKGIQTVWMHRN